MPKGYSKEIMEALFREEEQKQKEEEAKQAAKKEKQRQQLENFKNEIAYMQSEKLKEQFDALNKKLRRTQILAWVAILLALISTAAALGESLKNFMILLP